LASEEKFEVSKALGAAMGSMLRRRTAGMSSKAAKEVNPHFSILAVIAFIASFAVARTFTTLFPGVVFLVGSGIHIHHFWYGLILLAVGGWMGIVNQNQQIDQLAAILYGAGGGLIADEFGLLLTFGDYWSNVTYTIIAMLLSFALLGSLLIKHSGAIRAQFGKMSRNDAVLYLGILLGMVSIAFLVETTNAVVFGVAAILLVVASALVFSNLIFRLRAKRQFEKGDLAKHK
jgi:hypothetical protein